MRTVARKFLVLSWIAAAALGAAFASSHPALASQREALTPEQRIRADRYNQQERLWNVIRRTRPKGEDPRPRNQMTALERKPKDIAVFAVKRKQMKTALVSEYASDTMKAAITDPKDADTFYIPVVGSDRDRVELFRKAFGEPRWTKGLRQRGRSSWWIEELVPGQRPVMAKFMKPHGVDLQLARAAVFINDHVIRSAWRGGLTPDIQEEFAGFDFGEKLGRHVVVFRSTDPILDAQGQHEVVPGQGFYGNEASVEALAARMNKLPKHWKLDELAPLLGLETAEDHFVRFGAFETHTQNGLPQIDHGTGRILRTYRKDLNDVVLDLPLAILSGTYDDRVIAPPSGSLLNQIDHRFSEVRVAYAKHVGYQTALYTEQSLSSHTPGSNEARKLMLAFITAYRERVTGLTGVEFKPSEEYTRVWEALKSAREKEDLRKMQEDLLPPEYQKRKNPRINAMAFVIQEIYDNAKARLIRVDRWRDTLEAVEPRDLKRVRKYFLRELQAGEVAYTDAGGKVEIELEGRKRDFGEQVVSWFSKKPQQLDNFEFHLKDGHVVASKGGKIFGISIRKMKGKKS
jgi:hypothetical protein